MSWNILNRGANARPSLKTREPTSSQLIHTLEALDLVRRASDTGALARSTAQSLKRPLQVLLAAVESTNEVGRSRKSPPQAKKHCARLGVLILEALADRLVAGLERGVHVIASALELEQGGGRLGDELREGPGDESRRRSGRVVVVGVLPVERELELVARKSVLLGEDAEQRAVHRQIRKRGVHGILRRKATKGEWS